MKAGELLNFLSAQTPKRLRIKMLQKNIDEKATFVYSTPQFANNKWWTWYWERPDDLLDFSEQKIEEKN